MWVIFVILLIILLILFLISSLPLILSLIITTLPAWLIGIIFALIIFFGYQQYIIYSLKSPKTLSKLLKITFDGNKIIHTIENSELNKIAKITLPFSISLITCISVTSLVLYILYESGSFRGLSFSMMDIMGDRDSPTAISEQVALLFGLGLTWIPIAFTFSKLNSNRGFEHSIRQAVERLVNSTNFSLKRADELQTLINNISSLAERIKVQFPKKGTESIRNYIETNKSELLVNKTGIERLFDKEIAEAKEDKRNLETEVGNYEKAMSIYTQVSRKVNQTGSMPLIKELEYNYAGLTHNELKSLLTQKRWNEFHDIVNEIILDLQRLKDLAINYESYEEEYEKVEESIDETDEEKAYRILGVSPNATNEQIKNLYKKLAVVYHPDNKNTDDDERVKEINQAYGVLKKIRNIP